MPFAPKNYTVITSIEADEWNYLGDIRPVALKWYCDGQPVAVDVRYTGRNTLSTENGKQIRGASSTDYSVPITDYISRHVPFSFRAEYETE